MAGRVLARQLCDEPSVEGLADAQHAAAAERRANALDDSGAAEVKPSTLLVALCCIVWLHGCATTPRITTLPSVCPKPREQPVKLMGDLPEKLPALSAVLPKDATNEQKADALQYVRVLSGEHYAACLESRKGLIDWVRGE